VREAGETCRSSHKIWSDSPARSRLQLKSVQPNGPSVGDWRHQSMNTIVIPNSIDASRTQVGSVRVEERNFEDARGNPTGRSFPTPRSFKIQRHGLPGPQRPASGNELSGRNWSWNRRTADNEQIPLTSSSVHFRPEGVCFVETKTWMAKPTQAEGSVSATQPSFPREDLERLSSSGLRTSHQNL